MKNKIISLFSGAGGMDIGFHRAGFETAVAVEQDPSCCDTLRKNMPNVPILQGDITTITTNNILTAAKLKPLEAALVVGGPPCQSFSLAGKRMGMNDPRGRLVLEFLRIVRESLPSVFVIENVKGMATWEEGKAIQAILSEASEEISFNGKTYKYDVSYKILNAVNYGVPQFRERIIIIGNRLGIPFVFPEITHKAPDAIQGNLFEPKIKPWATVWDAIGHLPAAEEPSQAAIKVSKTIKDRIINHGY